MVELFAVKVMGSFGVAWTTRYTFSLIVGPLLSGGKSLLVRLFRAAQDGRAQNFTASFMDECDVTFGSRRHVSPRELFDMWKGSTFKFMDKVKSSGLSTTAWYSRRAGNHAYQGFIVLNPKPSLFSARVRSLYIYEEEE